jgi:hypothetical protein
LEADIKSNDWIGIRSELLARAPLLTDLDAQNVKFQRQLQKERDANLGATDACEKWAIEEMGPALKDYTVAEDNLFAFVKSNPTIGKETDSPREQLVDQHDSDLHKFIVIFSDANSHACDK